jgi:hypothetical protein
MDWANESYVKVYTRDTDDDLALSWEARAVWDRLMKKFDRSGMFESKRGPRGIAAATQIPLLVVERVLPELLADGRLVAVDEGYLAPNYIAAQEASKSDKLRQKESRDRRRARNLDGAITDRSQDVTPRDETVATVTLCSADPDPLLCSAPASRAQTTPSGASGEDPEQAQRRALGDKIWRELGVVRAEVATALGVELRPLHPQDQGRRALAMRIAESGDLERAAADCAHVLAVRKAEAITKRETRWLSGSMFEERGWRVALASSLGEAQRATAPRRDDPPKTIRLKDRSYDEPPRCQAFSGKTPKLSAYFGDVVAAEGKS